MQDSYAWHQAIWEAFPGRDGEDRDFLFQLDVQGNRFRLYVLSPTAPAVPGWGEWQSKEIAPSFLEYERYRFQLKANPTMRRSSDKRRLGIYDEKRLRKWMTRKAQQNGFAVDETTLAVSSPMDERFSCDGRRGKHVAVDFQGILNVTDRDAFRIAFEKGIGSAKAFGFGLLILQPIK